MATRRTPVPAVRPGRGAPGRPADLQAGLGLALRVPVFTVLTVTLAVTAHVAGGGALPGPGRLLFATVAVATTWWPLALREVRWWLVTAGVAAVQTGVHVVLLDPAGAGSHAHVSSPLMLGAHAAAALLVSAWIARGEALVWAAVRRVLPRLTSAPPIVVVGVRIGWSHGEPAAPVRWLLDRAGDPRRGPPVPAAY